MTCLAGRFVRAGLRVLVADLDSTNCCSRNSLVGTFRAANCLCYGIWEIVAAGADVDVASRCLLEMSLRRVLADQVKVGIVYYVEPVEELGEPSVAS